MTTYEMAEGAGLNRYSTARLNLEMKYSIILAIRKAKRSGVWSKVGQIQRGLLELSVKLEISFKSKALLTAVKEIIGQMIILTSFTFRNYLKGFKVAQRIVCFAAKNGYGVALSWLQDRNYVMLWGVFIR
jgi:hypothetical protein